ncbi:hypothetical protein BDV95DRAFT_275504 [Massariosphaeria phaeospora]|uniref:Uncharacterized protein n=1 Tax=Massariosphaeria phaeospora TaxID=100035 RepID=A0A7C8IBP4_9PLEO|nr:hypothetical protein BDV95DRAFT_275504 [Massariosphaeria phaeospora]
MIQASAWPPAICKAEDQLTHRLPASPPDKPPPAANGTRLILAHGWPFFLLHVHAHQTLPVQHLLPADNPDAVGAHSSALASAAHKVQIAVDLHAAAQLAHACFRVPACFLAYLSVHAVLDFGYGRPQEHCADNTPYLKSGKTDAFGECFPRLRRTLGTDITQTRCSFDPMYSHPRC